MWVYTTFCRAECGFQHSEGHGGHSHGHAHGVLDIPAGQRVPEIKVTTYPDAVRGWNLNIQVKIFRSWTISTSST